MSIQFKRLEIKDFLVYGGNATLEFPSFEPNRNLIIINGLNGSGKTSLLRSLQFVFHGLSQAELPEAWNDKAKQKGQGRLEVAIEFRQSDGDSKLIRWAEFEAFGRPRIGTRLIVAGEERAQVDDHIAQILPKECQQFVFFDGAEIQRYAKKQHEEGVKEAIERVLGIPAIRNLRLDLTRLVEDLQLEQAEIVSANSTAAQLSAEIYSLEEDLKAYQTKKAELIERRKGVESTLAELEKETAQIEAIAAEFDNLRAKKSRKADLEEKIRELDQQIQEYLTQAPLYLLLPVLRQMTASVEAKLDKPIPFQSLEYRKNLIEEVLSKEKCVCGRDLDNESERALHRECERIVKLLEAQRLVGEESVRLDRDTRELFSLVTRIGKTTVKAKDTLDKRALVDTQIEEFQKDIHDLESKLKGHEKLEVQEIFRQQGVLRHLQDEIQEQLLAVEKNIHDTAKRLEEKRREVDSISVGTARGRELSRVVDLVRRALRAVSEVVQDLVEERRKRIEELASQMFTEITNKPLEYARVRVKDDYTLDVYRKDGSSIENEKLSAGEKEVLAYSFITALNLSSVNPTPFVMDTPFGHLDMRHREGLLKSLPKLNVQVFLLATDRDLPESERYLIESHIAKEFWIRRDQQQAISYFEEI